MTYSLGNFRVIKKKNNPLVNPEKEEIINYRPERG
jgi:hypothetical protein